MKKKYKKDRYAKYDDIHEMYSSRNIEMDISIPCNFRMLCALLKVKPQKILTDFMWLLSYSYFKEGTEKQRNAVIKYFLACGYGLPAYAKKDIKKMFTELKARKKIGDTIDDMNEEERDLHWRNEHMYIQYWFKRWFYKRGYLDIREVLSSCLSKIGTVSFYEY